MGFLSFIWFFTSLLSKQRGVLVFFYFASPWSEHNYKKLFSIIIISFYYFAIFPSDLNVSWPSFIIINASIYLALLYFFHLVERSMQSCPTGNRMMWLSARASPWRLTWWDPKWGLVEREDMVPGLFCSSSHHHLPPLCPEARTRYYQRSTLVYGASLPLQWAKRGMLATGVTLGNQLKRFRGL